MTGGGGGRVISRSPGLESTAQRTLSESGDRLGFMTDTPPVSSRGGRDKGALECLANIRDEVHHEGSVPVTPQSPRS